MRYNIGNSRGTMRRRHMILIGLILGGLVLACGTYFTIENRASEETDYVSTYTSVLPRPSAPTPIVPASPSLLFYGGTLTIGSSTADDLTTFRSRIIHAASKRGQAREQVNAVSGIRIWSFIAQMQPAPAGIDLAVIELGTNDVGRTDPTDFRGGYDAVVTNVRTTNPNAGVLCIGTWGPSAKTKRYDYEIRESCRNAGGVFVPISRLYAKPQLRGPAGALVGGQVADAFNPNAVGHEAIAAAVLEAITFG
ncbi:SGNH/GDSL hydrolase family protein [Rhodococcus gordoniae]